MKQYIICIFIVLGFLFSCQKDSKTEYPLPEAAFSVSDSCINITDTVKFTNVSKNVDLETVKWFFDGGTPSFSNEASPHIIYYSPGTFSVKLVVRNIYGADSLILHDIIKVNSTLDSGLLAHYPLDSDAIDISDNQNHGFVHGATPSKDRFGISNKSLLFDGTYNYIEIPVTRIGGLNTYSYSVWIKPNGIPDNYSGMVYSIGDVTGGVCQAFVFQPTSTFYAASYNIGNNPQQSNSKSGVMEPDHWKHIVVTRDMSYIKLYIDNQLIPIQSNSMVNNQVANYGNPSRGIIGGRSNLSVDSFFYGEIDDMRIYNRCLNNSEISQLFRLR
jgi:PKD repeat protein